jgi:catechol 2,3-dioxygenase-like lactoylglutathione lyase family enzyme
MRGLNQVGIVVKDYKAAMDFYTQKLGIAEAYTIRRPDGIPQNRSDGVWTGIFAT